MSEDSILWVVRAILVAVGIIMTILVWKGKKEGRFHERYYLAFIVIGITAFTLGVILLVSSLVTDLTSFYGWYLTAAGAIALIIGLVYRNMWKKKHQAIPKPH